MKKLTARQMDLWKFINCKVNWRPPSYRSMREYMNVKSNQAIIDMLNVIKKKGYKIKRSKNGS